MQRQQMETVWSKNEIDKYLEEESLNIWYMTLSLIAKNVLAIPVSTVASESAFSTSGRILDPFRSSLSPKMLEVLICTQSWLKEHEQYSGIKLNECVDDIHSFVFFLVKANNYIN